MVSSCMVIIPHNSRTKFCLQGHKHISGGTGVSRVTLDLYWHNNTEIGPSLQSTLKGWNSLLFQRPEWHLCITYIPLNALNEIWVVNRPCADSLHRNEFYPVCRFGSYRTRLGSRPVNVVPGKHSISLHCLNFCCGKLEFSASKYGITFSG